MHNNATVTLLDKNGLEEQLKLLGYTVKVKSSKHLRILVNGSRLEELSKLAKLFGSQIDRSASALSISSIGIVNVNGIKLTVKPLSKQGSLSAGIENELMLIHAINKQIFDECVTVHFVSNKKKFVVNGVKEAKSVGRNTTGKKKSDVDLVLFSGQVIPISIKKDNAEIWESADSYWGKKAIEHTLQLVKEGKVKLIPCGAIYKVQPSFAVKATRKEKESVVFGSDILSQKGAIITRSFSDEDFTLTENGTLIVKCSYIITKLNDVTGEVDVWFLVRNDSTRVTAGIRGIRTVAVFERRINKNILRVIKE